MGTNYYLFKDACPHCGRGDDALHIGKSSCGWCFALHVYRDGEGPANLEEWKAAWSVPGVEIRNEHREKISPEDMLATITDREGRPDSGKAPFRYASLSEALFKNHAQIGPRNLWRHKIDGTGCIGHGDGTFDLIVGEFS